MAAREDMIALWGIGGLLTLGMVICFLCRTNPKAPAAWGLGCVFVISVISLYRLKGAPYLPDFPFHKSLSEGMDEKRALDKLIRGLKGRLTLDKTSLEGWLLLGQSYTIMEDHKKASDAYLQAVKLAPDQPHVALLLAEALIQASNGWVSAAAVETLKTIPETAPEYSWGQYYLGLLKVQLKDFEKARLLWQQILNRKDVSPQLRTLITHQLFKLP